MDQDFEPSHVPQQNLRNKLRVLQVQQEQQQQQQQSHQFPLAMYPSQLSPSFDKDLLSSNYQQTNLTNQLGFSNNLSLSLPGQLDSSCVPTLKDFMKQGSSTDQVRVLNLVPLGPFTGYSSILGSSKFLGPAQQVLEDICGGNCKSLELEVPPPLDLLVGDEDVTGTYNNGGGFSDGIGCGGKSSKLVLMLDEMVRRYKLYCQQVQSVLVSFRSVAGLGNAAPYIGCAIKVVSKYFTCLKNALLDQIQSTSKLQGGSNPAKDKPARTWRADPSLQNVDSAITMRLLQNPVWRSQRGLPDQAVAVLKTWLFEHFLHPYPTDSEKQSLAQQTGLSRTQVSNWFINARVRLWKPMVEEVHMLESQQAQVNLQQHSAAISHNSLAAAASDFLEGGHPQATCRHQCHEKQGNKRYRSELPGSYQKPQEELVGDRSSNGSLSSCNTGSSGSNVSLALGLHQNNGLDLSWPMPMDMAQHVNLEMIRMMGSASATTNNAFKRPPNQHFGRDV